MQTELKLPESGMGITEGTIAKWHKSAGDTVKKGDILAEVETAKAMTEIASPLNGILERIVVAEGVTVEVGATIALLRQGDECL